MKKFAYISHFTTLLFGISFGMIVAMFHEFNKNCLTTLIIPVSIMVVGIILRAITMAHWKKNKDKFDCCKKEEESK